MLPFGLRTASCSCATALSGLGETERVHAPPVFWVALRGGGKDRVCTLSFLPFPLLPCRGQPAFEGDRPIKVCAHHPNLKLLESAGLAAT